MGASGEKAVPIEQTGKSYKAQMVGGCIVLVVGMLMIFNGVYGWGAIVGAAGMAWYFAARFGAWWGHG